MKNDYKRLIISLLDELEDEKYLRYLYILLKQMLSR